jgi:putative restriction endonuclease
MHLHRGQELENDADMRLFVAVTDSDWFELLASQPRLEDVNFWQPGGNRLFRALEPGELFLFKLHSPADFVVGGGFFAHSTLLPLSLAWDSFGISNGARTLAEMRVRIEKYRHQPPASSDYQIGCILLEQPFFFAREAWIAVPADWSRNIVQGKTYDAQAEPGASLYRRVQEALRGASPAPALVAEAELPRYGNAAITYPRLGQGSFRVLVTDAYGRRCAATGERTLPVLQAAHIHPYAVGGPHRVDNGLLLRSDLHTLFDRGYVTVTPEARLEVSSRIREEFENGRDYYALHGNEIRLPTRPELRPSPALLGWHNEHVFLG